MDPVLLIGRYPCSPWVLGARPGGIESYRALPQLGVLPCDRGNVGGPPWLLRFVTMSARTRMNRQGNNRNYPTTQTNVANVERPFKGKCFNCEMEGHIARNCKAPKRARINTADAEEWATLEEEFAEPNRMIALNPLSVPFRNYP